MNKKIFLILSLIIIIIVSIITSLIAVYYLQKQVLLSGQLGTIGVTGLESGTVNVIVIDAAVNPKVSDIVQFSATWGDSKQTSLSSTSLPRPFVIRNDGTVNVNVAVYATSPLFSSANSYVTVWPGQITTTSRYMDSTGNPVLTLDDCLVAGPCYASTPCPTPGVCQMPVGEANKINLISSLYAANTKDEAVVNIGITVANDEIAGTKSTTMTIVGTAV